MTNSNKSKFNLNPKKIIIFFTVVLFLLVGFSVYKIFVLDQQEPKITAMKPGNKSTSSPSASTEPHEEDISSYTYLLNKSSQPLDASYVPADLVDPENVNSTTGVFEVRSEVASKLQEMVEKANEDGITLLVTTGYSSYEQQEQTYTSQTALLKEAAASMTCPKAGYSEHQLGLAVDFTDSADTPNQTTDFANTDAYRWLSEHSYEYGFILRYPENMEKVTGYTFEPWHYRYVGVDVATDMHNQNKTMEEYFGK